MDLLKEHNKKYQFFVDIIGIAMKVYNKYHYGLLESAYEAAITHIPYGMLINFSPDRIYSEWYERYSDGTIERVTLF